MVALRRQGVSRAAIEHALLLGFVFNVQNRWIDAFGYDIPEDKVGRAAFVLNLRGRRPARWPGEPPLPAGDNWIAPTAYLSWIAPKPSSGFGRATTSPRSLPEG